MLTIACTRPNPRTAVSAESPTMKVLPLRGLCTTGGGAGSACDAWRYQVAPRASAARSEMMERPDNGRVSRWCNGRYRAGVA